MEPPVRVIVKVAVFSPSLTVMSLIEKAGSAEPSMRVAVPTAAAAVVPETGMAVSVKVSEPSEMASVVEAKRSCTEVVPAAMLTLPDTVVHTGSAMVPLLNSRVPAAAVSVPRVAETPARDGVNTTAVVLELEMLTVKTAGKPSATEMLAMDKTGVSLSVMWPLPATPPMVRLNVSAVSLTVSLTVGTVTVKLVTPAGTITKPVAVL